MGTKQRKNSNKPKLTGKQQAFVAEYLVDRNAAQAAIRAGYSPKYADRMSYQLLGKTWVAEALAEAMAKQQERTQITADRVLLELARLATVDPTRMYDQDGNPRPLHELHPDVRACIAGYNKDGSYKLWDKNSALEKIGKHFKLYTDLIESKKTVNIHLKEYIWPEPTQPGHREQPQKK